ncbi:hypothetical protein BN59_01838 [Legionella massiliensis]|uniref:Uncharacterized protein n=1 Tax=Legionella massiliensis TaxID=1034943 RepID=A0A078KSZ5_9GAMM|nr:hypothetical protein BN59_01838 [Legionella massiliensis]CEE13293.1 hypothetical protein BN1094_01838 [Legionella massiliensis]
MFAPKGLGAPEDVRHVERRETSPECSTVLIPEIPHSVRDDGVFIDVCPKKDWRQAYYSIDTCDFHVVHQINL